jgi:hypothetical protein
MLETEVFVPVMGVQSLTEPLYPQTWFAPPLFAIWKSWAPAAAISETVVFVPVMGLQLVPEPLYAQTWFAPPLLATMYTSDAPASRTIAEPKVSAPAAITILLIRNNCCQQ